MMIRDPIIISGWKLIEVSGTYATLREANERTKVADVVSGSCIDQSGLLVKILMDDWNLIRLGCWSPVAWQWEDYPSDVENEGNVSVGTGLEGDMKPIDVIPGIASLPY